MTRRDFITATGEDIPVQACIQYPHIQIHQGKGFTHSDFHTGLASAATSTHLIVTGRKKAHIRYFEVLASGGPVNITYYEDTVVTDNGTQLGLGDNNRNTNNTPFTALYEGPTITDNGSPLGSSYIPDTSAGVGGGNAAGGAAILGGGEWILKPNTVYSFQITNNSGASIDYSISIFLYEDG